MKASGFVSALRQSGVSYAIRIMHACGRSSMLYRLAIRSAKVLEHDNEYMKCEHR